MKPSDVNAILAQVRQRLRKILFRQDITPPRELRDDVAAEILWRRRYASQLMEEALELWANTGEIASNDWPVIERLTGRPELRKMIEKFGKEVDQ